MTELREELRGRALWLVLDRPAQRNALSLTLIAAMRDALRRADDDAGVRALCITGAGEKAFCSGMDIGSMAAAIAEGAQAANDARRSYADLLLDLSRLGKPVVAAVNGAVMGGGMGLLAACDLAVAADDASFGTPEIKMGIFPFMALAPLARCIGRRAALELCLTGRKLDAAEARAIGLINRAMPRAELGAVVDELLDGLCEKSSVALRMGRRAFYETQDLAYEEQLETLCARLSLTAITEDAVEGALAFLEKRKPDFK
jgi:enoyl-CoA hydratase/carnithine racemase